MKRKVRDLVGAVCGITVGFVICSASSIEVPQAAYAMSSEQYAIISGIRGDGRFGPGSFELLSLSYSIENQSSGSSSGSSSAAKSHGAVGQLSFMKLLDVTTPQLMADVATGKTVSGDIYRRRVVGGKPIRYLHLHFVGTISAESLSMSSENGTDSVSIDLQQMTLSYTPILQNGTAGTQQSTSWNLLDNKSS